MTGEHVPISSISLTGVWVDTNSSDYALSSHYEPSDRANLTNSLTPSSLTHSVHYAERELHVRSIEIETRQSSGKH